jgi:uncharacterized repeat protein (TIGR03843 family)
VIELARALAHGELHVLGRLPDASNVAMLCEVRPEHGSPAAGAIRCIYKPTAGERPLWDFPGAVLAGREVLAAELSRCFGWTIIPETVWRDEGPAGPGMCQEWVAGGDEPPIGLFPVGEVPSGWHEVAEGHGRYGLPVVLAHGDEPDLQRMVVLDAILNNGDRKGGHLLRRPSGAVVGVDHGVSFHAEPHLRTVLWGWAGEPMPDWLLAELAAGAPACLDALPTGPARLSRAEVRAARRRLEALQSSGCFPLPAGGWPALPWPPM